jgi:hypothetical protein
MNLINFYKSMYTSFIGKKFLAAWNAREGRALTARQFFDEVMFPDFFDDERHLMHVHGSAFFQKVAEKDLATGKSEPQIRRENLHKSVATKPPSGSTFVGYAAEGTTGTTSGQVSGIRVKIEQEDVYASWIGEALAMGVSGGFYMLSEREELLLMVFEGWRIYRKFLNQTPNLKGRQVETWNGQWITYRLDGGDPDGFYPSFEEKTDVKTKTKYWAINTLEWTKLVFAFCKKFPGEVLTVYAYNLSQTNTTLGFLNLNLPEVSRLYQFRDKVFLDKGESVLTYQEIESLEPLFNFKRAAEFGAIGLRALEPNKLRDYLPQRDPKKNKDINLTKEDTRKQFQIFKLWIYAMLNRTELLELAGQIAHLLHQFEDAGKDRGKKVNDQLSEEVRGATSLRVFVDKLGEVLALFPLASETFRKAVDNAIKMPGDQLPLFVALIRFEYSYQKHQIKSI